MWMFFGTIADVTMKWISDDQMWNGFRYAYGIAFRNWKRFSFLANNTLVPVKQSPIYRMNKRWVVLYCVYLGEKSRAGGWVTF